MSKAYHKRICEDCHREVGVRVRKPRGNKPGRIRFYEHNKSSRSDERCPGSGVWWETR